MLPSKITWHGKLADGSRFVTHDGVFTSKAQITKSRKALLAFMKEQGYAVATLLADIQPTGRTK